MSEGLNRRSSKVLEAGTTKRLLLLAVVSIATFLMLAPSALAQRVSPTEGLPRDEAREKEARAEEDYAKKWAARLDCADVATRRGAQALFELNEEDRFDMDRDGNGVACEKRTGEAAEDGTKLGAKTGGDLDCMDFPSQKAAQAHLRGGPSDRDGLDPENNGVACEFSAVPYQDLAFDDAPVAAARSEADLDCEDFEYQQEAQVVYRRDVSDPNGLDGPNEKAEKDERFVGNGVACETAPLLASNVEEFRATMGTDAEGAEAAPSTPAALVAAWPHGGGPGFVLDLVALLLVASGVSTLLIMRRARRPSGGSGQ